MSHQPMHEPRPSDADATGDELSDDELESVTGGTNTGMGQPAYLPPAFLPPIDDPAAGA